MITLYNNFHAGDIVMSRQIIRDIASANPGVKFRLSCQPRNAYLWTDLGFPVVTSPPLPSDRKVNLHFAAFPDSLATGLTYRTQVANYNRQAVALGLAKLDYDGIFRPVDFPPTPAVSVRSPAVLLETGPVLSGQRVHDLSKVTGDLAMAWPKVTFYTSSTVPFVGGNVVDVSSWHLAKLSSLSEQCAGLVCRLSAVMVCTFTEKNHGRKRIVYGEPLGCPIWDEAGLVYGRSVSDIHSYLREVVR